MEENGHFDQNDDTASSSTTTLWEDARKLGRIEGRAESAEEIAALYSQIADLHRQLGSAAMECEASNSSSSTRSLSPSDFKSMLSNLYKRLKAVFHDDPSKDMVCAKIKSVMRHVTLDDLIDSGERHTTEAVTDYSANADNATPQQFPKTHEKPHVISGPYTEEVSVEEKPVVASDSSVPDRGIFVPRSDAIRILIAEKKGQGRSMHISYTIENSVTKDTVLVHRRFRDFSSLHKRLIAAFPNIAVPLLPPKGSFRKKSKFSFEFVEKRKRYLQTWLKYVGSHTLLSSFRCTQYFMQASDDEWASYIISSEADQKPPVENRSVTFASSLSQRQNAHQLSTCRERAHSVRDRLSKCLYSCQQLVEKYIENAASRFAMDAAIERFSAFEHGNQHEASGSVWALLRGPLRSTVTMCYDTAKDLNNYVGETTEFYSVKTLPLLIKQFHGVNTSDGAAVEQIVVEYAEFDELRSAATLENLINFSERRLEQQKKIREGWLEFQESIDTEETDTLSAPSIQAELPKTPTEFDLFGPLRKSDSPIRSRTDSDSFSRLEHPTISRPVIPEESGRWPPLHSPHASSVPKTDEKLDNNGVLETESKVDIPSSINEQIESKLDEAPQSKVDTEDWNISAPPPAASNWDKYIDRQRRKQRRQSCKELDASARENYVGKSSQARRTGRRHYHQPKKRPVSHTGAPSSVSIPVKDFKEKDPSIDNASSERWIEVNTSDGKTYYYHKLTRQRRWQKPEADLLDSMEERIQSQQKEVQNRLESRRKERDFQRKKQEEMSIKASAISAKLNSKVATWTGNKSIVEMLQTLSEISPIPVALPLLPESAAYGRNEVKKAYMQAVRLVHPDKLASYPLEKRLQAQAVFTTITSAYEQYQENVNVSLG